MRKVGFMRKLGFIIGIIVLLMAVMPLSMPMSGGLAVQADSGWYWKPGINLTDYAPSGMPDFDQKQDMWKPSPAGAWSYCGPVAVANSLWWFDSANEPNPQPPSNISDHYGLVTSYNASGWDDHDPQNVMPLVNNLALLMKTGPNGTNVTDMQAGIDQYLNMTGYAANYTEMTVPWPEFDWIRAEVEKCQDVVLLLGFWNRTEMPPGSGNYYYERIGGHYVTVAGVNLTANQTGISDPYYDNAEAGGPGVVIPVAHNHTANGTGTHNDTLYVSHDIYNVTRLIPGPGPGGHPCWALLNYTLGKDITNFIGQNGGGFPIPGPVVTIIDYAVDVSPIITYTLTMAVNGIGTTTPAVGSYSYPAGTVPITATPGAGWQFVNWTTAIMSEIADPTAASTTVTVDADKTVTANFALEWYWKPGNWTDYAPSGMPDFDQKQDQWTDPMGNWTYCGPVAVANSLWWFDSRAETSGIPPPASSDNYYLVTSYNASGWDDHDPQNVIPLVNNLSGLMNTGPNGTDVMDMQQGIRDYLNATGYAANYNETTMLRPNFTWIEGEVERCEDVVLLLGFWQAPEDYLPPEAWWRIGGHYVTVAGVNSSGLQLGISDPYFDNAEMAGPGVVLPAVHTAHPGNATVHNDAQYVSHDIYNVRQLILGHDPFGNCALQNYANGQPIVNFQGQNSGLSLIPPGGYIQGFPVVTVIDYAVAVSPMAGATLEGHVNLTTALGAAPKATWVQPFVVKGFAPGITPNATNALWTRNATTDEYGVFVITGLTPDTYDIGIKNCTCLSELETGVVLTEGNLTEVYFDPIREGDCSEDDAATAGDRGLLYDGWNSANIIQSGHLCDLNRDGGITAADRGLLYDQWNKGGAAYGAF